MQPMEKTRVLYNADCPVCRFEIHHYRDYAQDGDLDITFDDLNTADLARWNLTEDAAARRLYVLDGKEMTSGIPAFLVLWSRMPRYRWLARVVGLPVIRPVCAFLYDRVLAPLIYRWHRRRQARRASG